MELLVRRSRQRPLQERDAGKTWQKVTKGLPEGTLGRIAIAVAPSRSSVVYANVESAKTALYRSDDQGSTWTSVSSAADVTARPFYFNTLTIDPKDHNLIYKPGFGLSISRDGGKSFSPSQGAFHGDVHAVWVNPEDTWSSTSAPTGACIARQDFGNKWQMVRNLPVSQFYHVSFDIQQPYNVYGGLQDNGSWTGPSRAFNGVKNADWKNIGIGDGFYAFADPSDRNVVVAEYQGGKVSRFNLADGRAPVDRAAAARGRPEVPLQLEHAGRDQPDHPWRYVHRRPVRVPVARPRRVSWERISDDLTTNDPKKQQQEGSGGLTTDNSSAENHSRSTQSRSRRRTPTSSGSEPTTATSR